MRRCRGARLIAIVLPLVLALLAGCQGRTVTVQEDNSPKSSQVPGKDDALAREREYQTQQNEADAGGELRAAIDALIAADESRGVRIRVSASQQLPGEKQMKLCMDIVRTPLREHPTTPASPAPSDADSLSRYDNPRLPSETIAISAPPQDQDLATQCRSGGIPVTREVWLGEDAWISYGGQAYRHATVGIGGQLRMAAWAGYDTGPPGEIASGPVERTSSGYRVTLSDYAQYRAFTRLASLETGEPGDGSDAAVSGTADFTASGGKLTSARIDAKITAGGEATSFSELIAYDYQVPAAIRPPGEVQPGQPAEIGDRPELLSLATPQ